MCGLCKLAAHLDLSAISISRLETRFVEVKRLAKEEEETRLTKRRSKRWCKTYDVEKQGGEPLSFFAPSPVDFHVGLKASVRSFNASASFFFKKPCPGSAVFFQAK